MMSDVVWDEVMHYVDPEMDIGSYAITIASNPGVCLGSEALGSEALGKALDKALDEDLGKALGNRNPSSKALGNGRSGSAIVYRGWLHDSVEMENKAPLDKIGHICGRAASISFITSSKLGARVGLDIGLDLVSDMTWDKVVHCVDPEMDIGSCTLSKTSDLVCFGNGTLGGRSLDSKALGEAPNKALDDDLGKALGPE